MRSKRLVSGALAAVAVAAIGGAFAPLASAGPVIEPVISGLNAPRGLVFDGAGNLYVAESGKFRAGPDSVSHTGRVTKFEAGSFDKEWSTRFESVASSENGPNVVGPEGLSANAGCTSAHPGNHNCQIFMIMSDSQRQLKLTSHLDTDQMGVLYRLNSRNGDAHAITNAGDQTYNWTNDHVSLAPLDFPDANPYGVLATGRHDDSRIFVIDAAANTVNRVGEDGKLHVVAYIPNDGEHDSTPTCAALGPDGMLYVGTLSFFANASFGGGFTPGGNPGHSKVYRVDPNASFPTAPQLWATGLTTITSCTFDRSGNFWAAEMFYPNSSGPPGDLARINASQVAQATTSQVNHIGGGQVPLPGGVAQGPDGDMYATVGSADTTLNAGAVVRVAP